MITFASRRGFCHAIFGFFSAGVLTARPAIGRPRVASPEQARRIIEAVAAYDLARGETERLEGTCDERYGALATWPGIEAQERADEAIFVAEMEAENAMRRSFAPATAALLPDGRLLTTWGRFKEGTPCGDYDPVSIVPPGSILIVPPSAGIGGDH